MTTKRMTRLMWVLAVAGAASGWEAKASDVFTKPTPEELTMTAQPGFPGVPAVILFREEITRDDNHSVVHYERIKVLTEKGKEYANVELRFATSKGDGYYEGDDKNITDIAGRTIHPDGTIIPFTGKPYLKMLENVNAYKYQARVFTLPDVEVGSIIEYRYITRIGDNIYEAPDWYIQTELFMRAAHFAWYPTSRELMSEKGTVSAITWFPVLPTGTEVKKKETPAAGGVQQQTFEVTLKDVPPTPSEDYMPPIRSFSYRVNFSYMPYRSGAEYWKATGSDWSKRLNAFTNPDKLIDPVQPIIAGATTQDAKLRKIYAAVMALENTDFTRRRARTEDKAQGLGKVANAADVLEHKRGNSRELTELFVGLARAAGMKAYFMLVPDRSVTLFVPQYTSYYQFDDLLAIVNVDGKEQYFDPGQRYCGYGQLAWQDTYASGLRQVEGGTDFGRTPGDAYTANTSKRVGDLAVDAQGVVHGTVTVTYAGAPALQWRQRALEGDEESVRKRLRVDMERTLPRTLEVKVLKIEGEAEYDKPFVVTFDVKGPLGTATGKRLLLPADIFVAQETDAFPHEKRDLPVYFHYAQMVQDAVRYKFPPEMAIEAAPATAKTMFMQQGSFFIGADAAADSVTVRRNLLVNTILVGKADYPALRTFYSDMEAKDRESIVLKLGSAGAGKTGN